MPVRTWFRMYAIAHNPIHLIDRYGWRWIIIKELTWRCWWYNRLTCEMNSSSYLIKITSISSPHLCWILLLLLLLLLKMLRWVCCKICCSLIHYKILLLLLDRRRRMFLMHAIIISYHVSFNRNALYTLVYCIAVVVIVIVCVIWWCRWSWWLQRTIIGNK